MDSGIIEDWKRLSEFTKECRSNMHEPDEQDIYAQFGPHIYKFERGGQVIQTTLDNADPSEMSYDMGFWLIHREYYPDHSYKEVREWFNLASVIAMARAWMPYEVRYTYEEEKEKKNG